MKKYSIFSKDYERKKRKRKIKYISLFGAVALSVAGIGIVIKGIEENKSNSEKVNIENVVADTEKEATNIVEEVKPRIEKVVSSKKVEVDSAIINLEFEKENIIKSVTTSNEDIKLDISPNKEKVLVSDSKNQKNIIVDAHGNVTDVSVNVYRTKKGETFKKEDIMKEYDGYIWSRDAKFIDNENIAYITNRPYFSHKTRNEYIGVTNINTLKNKINMNIKGRKLDFGERMNEGIVVIDGNRNVVLNNIGTIIE